MEKVFDEEIVNSSSSIIHCDLIQTREKNEANISETETNNEKKEKCSDQMKAITPIENNENKEFVLKKNRSLPEFVKEVENSENTMESTEAIVKSNLNDGRDNGGSFSENYIFAAQGSSEFTENDENTHCSD